MAAIVALFEPGRAAIVAPTTASAGAATAATASTPITTTTTINTTAR